MGIVVERHRLELPEGSDRAFAKARVRLFELRTLTTVTSSQLVGAVDRAEVVLAYAAAADRVDAEIRDGIALGARAGAARFHAAVTGPFTTTFGGPPVAVPGDPVDAGVNVGRFRLAWALATLADDGEALPWLVLFPTGQLAGPVDGREVRLCAALQGITEGRPAGPTLDEPPPPGPATPPPMQPILAAGEALLRAFDRGPAAFDEALVRYLEAHRARYAEGESRRDVLGAVAPLALAVVAIARRRHGWTVGVTSPYLPLGAIA